jgi:hypothetical protein
VPRPLGGCASWLCVRRVAVLVLVELGPVWGQSPACRGMRSGGEDWPESVGGQVLGGQRQRQAAVLCERVADVQQREADDGASLVVVDGMTVRVSRGRVRLGVARLR